MAIFHFEGHTGSRADVGPEEAAAVLAAVTAFQDATDATPSDQVATSRWLRAARAEAVGLAPVRAWRATGWR